MPHANLRLLASGKSSDFTIICQDVKFKVHKAIICPESSFFRAACTNNFKERHEATLLLPEEDPEILARVLLLLYTRDVYTPSITKEIEETLAKLVPGGPTTERSEFETSRDVSSLISRFKEEDMDDDFTAFVEKLYNDIPAKDDPLRTQVTVETLERLWGLNLLRGKDISDDSDMDAPKRIQALIQANEPSALNIAIDIISMLRGWES